MKLSKWFFVIIAVLVAFMVLFEIKMPNRFDWHSDLRHGSKQPFGLFVFDSVLTASVPQGYSLTGQSLTQLAKSKNTPTTYLIVSERENYLDVDVKAIRKMLNCGNNFIFVFSSCYSGDDLSKLLNFTCLSTYYDYYYDNDLLSVLKNDQNVDTIHCERYGSWKSAKYNIRNGLCKHELKVSKDFHILAQVSLATNSFYSQGSQAHDRGYGFTNPNEKYDDYEDVQDEETVDDDYETDYSEPSYDEPVESPQKDTYPIAAVRKYGKGRVVVASTPLLFTNFGILNDNICPYVLRVLSAAGNSPIVRIDETLDETGTADQSQSPLRYLIHNPPLRWALYVSIVVLLLFLIFSARRRQRVIPVMAQPENMSMAMVKHIGTLYYQRRDNKDLLLKKYAYFSEHLRREVMVDLDDDEHFDGEIQALSRLAGVSAADLKAQIHEVWAGTHKKKLNDKQLKHFINIMNDILKKIST